MNLIKETTFIYNGAEYTNRYGIYMKNRRLITRDEYRTARKSLLTQKDDPDSLSYDSNLSSKELAQKSQDIETSVASLTYDKDYRGDKKSRGHIERFSAYDNEGRIEQIISDTGFSEEEATRVNKIISEYTSTNNYTRFTDEEKKLLDKYIDASPIYISDPLYRGLGFREKLGNPNSLDFYHHLLELDVGMDIVFNDYVSFSSNPDIAVEFAYDNGEYQVYIINTKNLTGVSVDHLSSIDYPEEEIIYKAHTSMLVKGRKLIGDTLYLHVEEDNVHGDGKDSIEVQIKGNMSVSK